MEGVKCTAHFKVFADSQKESLLQAFRDEAIDVATTSALLGTVKDLPLSNDDTQALVCGVAEAASRPRAPVPLRYNQGQDFRGFVQFFLAEEWDALLDDETSAEVKLVRVLQKVVSLGCAVASEKTKRVMTALWMMVSEGFNKAVQRSAAQKHGRLRLRS